MRQVLYLSEEIQNAQLNHFNVCGLVAQSSVAHWLLTSVLFLL